MKGNFIIACPIYGTSNGAAPVTHINYLNQNDKATFKKKNASKLVFSSLLKTFCINFLLEYLSHNI